MGRFVSSLRNSARRHTPRVLNLLLLLALSVDLGLGLWLGKKIYFPFSLTTPAYLSRVAEAISSATGYVFWALFIAFGILGPLLMGRRPRTTESASFTEQALKRVAESLQKLAVSTTITALLVIAVFPIIFGLVELSRPPAPPRSGKYVIPTDPESHIFLRVVENYILMYDLGEFGEKSTPMQALHVGDATAIDQILVANKPRRLYASDPASGLVHVVDWAPVLKEVAHIYVGKTVGALALTPDGRKLYAGITGPIPLGKILVFDTGNRSQVASIEGLGCPMDLFAASAAPRLFVATQCGAGYDPLYVIDTRTDNILAKVSGFAVGSSVAATPDGTTAFALAGGSPSVQVTPHGEMLLVSLQNRLSVVRNYAGKTPEVKSFSREITAMAITPNSQFLLVGTQADNQKEGFSGGALLVLDLNRTTFCKAVPLAAPPTAIVIAPDGAYRAFLPDGIPANVGDTRALACDY